VRRELDIITKQSFDFFETEERAREQILCRCRQIVRNSANVIRVVHRQEQDKARELLNSTQELVHSINEDFGKHYELVHSGFVHDAQKEFAEGYISLALVYGEEMPGPDEIGVSHAAYLNGRGETAGELRRYLFDSLRRGDLSHGEDLLNTMDDIYGVLMLVDFPEALTHGLRHTSDAVRGTVERTMGDLAMALIQRLSE